MEKRRLRPGIERRAGVGCRLRPAGDRRSGPSAGLLHGERLRADLVEQVLEGVEAEHRALEPRGTDVDAEEVQQVRGAESATSATGLPLISSVSSDADAWLIAQPRPVNPTSRTTPSSTASCIVIRSPHSGLAPS